MFKDFSFRVREKDIGQRLDIFLSNRLSNSSRSSIQRWIISGCVTVDGEPRQSKYRLKEGNKVLLVSKPVTASSELIPESIPLEILYEDDSLIVINKPAGMVVHPGAGNWRGTLANALLHHFHQVSRLNTVRPGIVHRLDKLTSGVLVVAKNEVVHNFLADQFKQREVEKHYFALVHGDLKQPQGKVDISLGRHPQLRTKISTYSRRTRRAVTHYRVVKLYSQFSYVDVMPLTGRTHQIRVHFQYLGNPIVGDGTYGNKITRNLNSPLKESIHNLERHFLHAFSLSFRHPKTKKKVFFKAPLPAELEDFLRVLE